MARVLDLVVQISELLRLEQKVGHLTLRASLLNLDRLYTKGKNMPCPALQSFAGGLSVVFLSQPPGMSLEPPYRLGFFLMQANSVDLLLEELGNVAQVLNCKGVLRQSGDPEPLLLPLKHMLLILIPLILDEVPTF